MKKNFPFFFILCLLISCSKNEQKKPVNKTDSDSTAIYIRLANVNEISVDKKKLYFEKAFEKAITQSNDSITRNHLLDISIGFLKTGNSEELKKSSTTLINNSIKSQDTLNLAQGYRYLAGYYRITAVNDSAFIYFSKAEKLFKSLNDKNNEGAVLSSKSVIQYNVGDFVGSDRSLTRAYSLLKDTNQNDKLYVIFTMMGIVANETKDYEKAIKYYTKTLEIIKENNLTDNYQEATCLNNIGYVYQNKGDYKEAIKNYTKALKDKTIIDNDPELYSLLTDNLAYCKFKLNDYEGLPNLFYTSLKVREQIDAKTLIVLSKIHLSEYYFVTKQNQLSQKFATEALIQAKSTGISRDFLAALKQASVVDNVNSSKYSKDYIRINDSIQDVERLSQEKFARLALETDEIIQENEGLAESNRNLLYVFVVSFILVVLLFVVRAQRARTRELLYKQAQQKANEDIYNLMMSQQAIIDESRNKEKKRLAQDLHDGVLGRMFGLRLNLDSLNSSTEEDAVQKRFELLNELKTIEQDIREISHDLNREKQVLINNFVSIVHNLLEEQKTSFEVNVNYTIDENVIWDKVSNAIKINLYRILQEGLQNINKYANAKNILVEIKGNEENVYLKIQDDGIGFDVNKKSKGIGMQNMISRTHDCKGIIDIASKKGNGTKIVITIPIETKQPIIVEQE
ncbi:MULTISPECIES: sensor histidine kinase [unclassified Flavobacterium]|uniref:ATP-binding protein n=1 Tax=unclassified Flavobacterium TaxID=196869 RepID=UPI000EB2ACA7|nr:MULTISPECIES: sensor histidine kinase [unclassified Flavobacterium]RKS00967.1 histidine kinase/DNA gyrase B/HSP90-like ATPase [Flavobacterium sp. 102]